jgi:uncharacterized PurR-regulated membrane protein YhhQ (DUF165 family)
MNTPTTATTTTGTTAGAKAITAAAAKPECRTTSSGRSVVLGVVVAAWYLFAVVAANVASVHLAPLMVGGLVVPAGTLFAGASLTARDILHDTLGPRWVAAGILVGAGLSAVVASPQIAAASVVAFTVSEILDSLVYTRLRRRTRLSAVAVSNVAGLVVDSLLFVPLAFGNFAAVPGQIMGKTIATILTLGDLHLTGVIARRMRRRP